MSRKTSWLTPPTTNKREESGLTIQSIETKNPVIERESDQRCLESPKYSCALGGALGVITNIDRLIPILHTGQGCGSNQLLSFRQGGGNQGSGYMSGLMTPSSNLAEKEVVFGGEERLEDEIRTTIELIDGDAYVVANGCIAGMIGDDIEAVVAKFANEKTPVGYVDSSGFAGNTWYGYEETFISFIKQFTKAQPIVKKRVNILGFVPYQDVFWRGNLAVLGDSLRAIGLDVTQVVGDFSGLDGIKRLSSAELTIVVSPWVGVRAAQEMEKKYGIPYITFPNVPVGPRDTTEFILTVAKALKLPKQRVVKYVTEQQKRAYYELDIAGDICAQFASALPFAITANAATSAGITRFLVNEAGFTPVVVVVNDDPPLEVRDVILDRFETLDNDVEAKVFFESDSYAIRKILDKFYFRVILASSQERFSAADENQIHLSVTFPSLDRLVVNRTYAGYGGGIAILEDFLSKFIMPY
jgi:nitrogenase molybdenum-iron protein beta chain